MSRCKYQIKQQRVLCYVAVLQLHVDTYFDDLTHAMYQNSPRMAPCGLKHVGLFQCEYIYDVSVGFSCKIVSLGHVFEQDKS